MQEERWEGFGLQFSVSNTSAFHFAVVLLSVLRLAVWITDWYLEWERFVFKAGRGNKEFESE